MLSQSPAAQLPQRPHWMEPLPPTEKRRAHKASASDAEPAPRALKHRRSSKQATKAAAHTAAFQARNLTLTHTPAPPKARDEEAMRASLQWTQHHLDFLSGLRGLTGQGLALASVSAGAGGATAGFLANVGQVGPFGPAFAALALLSSCVDIYNAKINAQDARSTYLSALILLAEQQEVMAGIKLRASDGTPRPEDASLLPVTEKIMASLQDFLAHYESGFFHDPQSPHAQHARRELDQQAHAMVALKREFDDCGERMRRALDQREAPDLSEEQKTGFTDDIKALERRRAQLLLDAQAGRKTMKGKHSHKRMQAATKQNLANAREELERAQHQAFLSALDGGPDLALRIRSMRFQRHVLLLKLLRDLPDAEAQKLPLNMELLERWDAEMLAPETVQVLEAALASIDSDALRAIDQEIADAENGLEAQQADNKHIAQLQEQVRALEADLKHLDRRLDKLLLDPFGDRGSDRLAALRDNTLSIVKNLLDAGATVNTASIVWQLLPALMSSLYLILPGVALGMIAGAIDIQGGKHIMAAASAGKGPLINKANHAAELLRVYQDDERLERSSLQYALHAQLEMAAQQMWALHHDSQFGKTRKLNGAQAIANGGLLLLTGIVTLVTGVPVVLGPAAIGGISGMSYAGRVSRYLFNLREQKHGRKQRATVARAFIKRFGVEGIAELQKDLAEGYPGRWTDRLGGFRRELLATKEGRNIPPRLLQPQALASNTPLNIERLTRALSDRARDQRVGSPSAEAELVSSLAQAQGLPDPSSWKLDAFASVQDHERAVRAALHQLFGSTPQAPRSPLFKDPREMARVATRVDFWLQRHFSHRNALTEQDSLASWIASVAQQPATFGARLAALSSDARRRLQDQVAHLGKVLRDEGIGPRELLALQAVSVNSPDKDKVHALKEFPLLTTPQAPYLLELIANPAWLADPSDTAPSRSTPPMASQPLAAPVAETVAGAELVSKLTDGIKRAGRSMRDGPAVSRPRLPPEAGVAAPPRLHRNARLPRRAKHAVRTQFKSLAKHIYQQMPNPMATPAKAMDALSKTRGDAPKQQELLQTILLSFAQEVLGPDFALQNEPQVMASLLPHPDTAEVDRTAEATRAADVKRAHLLAWLQRAGEAARTTAASMDSKSEDRPQVSKDLQRMARRMQDTQRLCNTLSEYLQDGTRPWEATLLPIAVS